MSIFRASAINTGFSGDLAYENINKDLRASLLGGLLFAKTLLQQQRDCNDILAVG